MFLGYFNFKGPWAHRNSGTLIDLFKGAQGRGTFNSTCIHEAIMIQNN